MLSVLMLHAYAAVAWLLLDAGLQALLGDAVILVALLAVFAIAAELIVKGTQRFEAMLGQGMAGGVILGSISSLPETIFVIVAVAGGSYSVAIGAALGGNIILFTLGIGLIGVIYFSRWGKDVALKEDYRIDISFLMLSTLAILLLLLYGRLDAASGILLCLVYVVYIAYRYSKAHSRLLVHMKSREGRAALLKALGLMVLGVVMIALLSDYFIGEITGIAGALAIPAIWLSLVLAPIGADAAELISSYRLARASRGGGSTAVVSFIGSKLENNTILLGIIGLAATAPVYLRSAAPEVIGVLAINAIAIAIFSRGRVSRLQGVALVALYFAVLALAFIL